MRISDWSSDVYSSDLHVSRVARKHRRDFVCHRLRRIGTSGDDGKRSAIGNRTKMARADIRLLISEKTARACMRESRRTVPATLIHQTRSARLRRSEEHTSELQSLMRISYAVFCLK